MRPSLRAECGSVQTTSAAHASIPFKPAYGDSLYVGGDIHRSCKVEPRALGL
jgi:hypothetical protein